MSQSYCVTRQIRAELIVHLQTQTQTQSCHYMLRGMREIRSSRQVLLNPAFWGSCHECLHVGLLRRFTLQQTKMQLTCKDASVVNPALDVVSMKTFCIHYSAYVIRCTCCSRVYGCYCEAHSPTYSSPTDIVCMYVLCPGDQLRANRQSSVYVKSSSQNTAL